MARNGRGVGPSLSPLSPLGSRTFDARLSGSQETYIAAHLDVGAGATVDMGAGDMKPWDAFPGVAPHYQGTGDASAISGSDELPTVGQTWAYQGSGSGYISAVTADLGLIYDTGIRIVDINAPIETD